MKVWRASQLTKKGVFLGHEIRRGAAQLRFRGGKKGVNPSVHPSMRFYKKLLLCSKNRAMTLLKAGIQDDPIGRGGEGRAGGTGGR